MESSTHEVIARAQRGDREAFKTLYERFHPQVYRVAYRFLNDHHQAEDVMEDVFFAVFTQLDRFEARSAFSTYLYRITMNICKNRLRPSPIRHASPLEDLANEPVSTGARPDQPMETRQLSEAIHRSLNRLSPEYREILLLADQENLPPRDLCAILNVSPKQARDRLYRARQAFREHFPLSHDY